MYREQCYLEETRKGAYIIIGFLVAALVVFGLVWKGCGLGSDEGEVDLGKYMNTEMPADGKSQADPSQPLQAALT